MKYYILTAIMTCALNAASIIDVLPGVNNVPITQAVFEVNGTTVTQASQATGVTATSATVNLKSLTVNDNGSILTLNFFNDLGASIVNMNLPPNLEGVGVLNGADKIPLFNNVVPFTDAVAAASQNTNILNYVYYDYLSFTPAFGVPDYSIMFVAPFQNDDYMMVAERNLNSQFILRPLDQNGNLIVGTNAIRFAGDAPISGDPMQRYDWNTGYASSHYISNQVFGISVASTELFFRDTGLSYQPIYGFLIDNDGEADFKLLGMSTTQFVPEPAAALLGGIGMLLLLQRRQRTAK
jgi:hypothetical protein